MERGIGIRMASDSSRWYSARSQAVHPDDLERHALILPDLVARAQQMERTR